MKKRFQRIIAMFTMAVLFMSLFSPYVSAQQLDKADTVYINGNIYTVDKEFSAAQALAVTKDRFTYVGSNDEVQKYIGANTKVIDLKGKTVLPGLIESHTHYTSIGIGEIEIDAHWKPKQEILDAVAKAYKEAKPGDWILGGGWNQVVWNPAEFPTKEELDAVAPDIPVVLDRTCGHAYWANSKAFELAGITKNTKDPVGGEILKNKDGEPLGVVTDQAKKFLDKVIPNYSQIQYERAMLLAQDKFFRNGLVSTGDAGVTEDRISMFEKLYKSEDLKIRLYVMARPDASTPQELLEDFRESYAKGQRIGLYDNRLTIRSIKLFMDGSLGARSAWMLEEYSDRPGHLGNGILTNEELYKIVKEARQAGFQVNSHAIGDAGNRQALDAYEKVLKEMPDPDNRYRLEHAQILALEDIPRFAKLGVIPSMQTVAAVSDKNMAEDRIGAERIKGGYAWRKLIDSGSIIANGTDAPVDSLNPFNNLYCAVTRMDADGNPKGGWYPEECLTREEALRSYTNWSAYANFAEKLQGSIEVGKLADFVVIDRDYMTCPTTEIKDIKPLRTVLGGETVYIARDKNEIGLTVNGSYLDFEVSPDIYNGTVMMPLRSICEALGAKVEWNRNTNEITIVNGIDKIVITTKNKNIIKNSKNIYIKENVKFINGRTLIPITFINEILGFKADWNQDDLLIKIKK